MKRTKLFGLIALTMIVILSCDRQTIEPDIQTFKGSKNLRADGTPCPYIDDADCDGFSDASDNCPNNYNPGQEDVNGNGIGDVCESSGTPPPPKPVSGDAVTAEYYYDNYCLANDPMSTGCGLAKGIKEVLLETKDLFKNTIIYNPVIAYYKIDEYGGTDLTESTAATCPNSKCYITVKSTSGSSFQIRQANVSYLNEKLAYIDGLISQYPNYTEHYNAYKSGCTQAFWFSNDSLPIFILP
ncbi:hypothetical protein [Pedobacter rhodius]|uniref:Thrombospondin type 3 repeat-containing protein n=1 Tax=Pedobacter rhodius TaxID=3004098 RepID=A0ABT4KUP0_9SPHI|nr:hypothetical protein [Pedobacter sp. SJ11]MCZ4222642.1 hypothetical protein [Pedobacter sp. SJ11]